MPAIKLRNPFRPIAGLILSSGSVAKRVTELFVGSALANSPSFAALLAASRASLAVAVTGLDASHVIVVTAGSLPGNLVLTGACAITDSIETTWLHPGSEATSGCAITLNYIAFKDKAQ